MTTHWIAQLEIEAESVLPEDVPAFEYSHPRGEYTVRLLNRSVVPLAEKPMLEMQLVFFAETIDVALERARLLAREFLHWLSFVSQSYYRISKIERLIDWTPGLSIRDQFQFHTDRSEMPQPVLLPELGITLAILQQNECALEIKRALRWFANGLAARLMDDQFQCFFFAIEIVAEHRKAPDRVPDKCPQCQGELVCPACNTVPTHRPYAKQAIQQLLQTTISDDPQGAFKDLDIARNGVMHGRLIEDVEKELKKPFERIVDLAGHLAWTCIFNSISFTPGKYDLPLAHATTFVAKTMSMKVRMRMGATGGDIYNPRLEDQGSVQISVVAPADTKPEVAIGGSDGSPSS